MDGFAIQQFFTLRRRKAGGPVQCAAAFSRLWARPGKVRVYSLQGGASMIRATLPDQQSLRSASKTLSSRMSCAASLLTSKGSKQSRSRLMAADVTGCSLPANTSKKSCFQARCNCQSAGGRLWLWPSAGFATVCGRQGWRQGRLPWPLRR